MKTQICCFDSGSCMGYSALLTLRDSGYELHAMHYIGPCMVIVVFVWLVGLTSRHQNAHARNDHWKLKTFYWDSTG